MTTVTSLEEDALAVQQVLRDTLMNLYLATAQEPVNDYDGNGLSEMALARELRQALRYEHPELHVAREVVMVKRRRVDMVLSLPGRAGPTALVEIKYARLGFFRAALGHPPDPSERNARIPDFDTRRGVVGSVQADLRPLTWPAAAKQAYQAAKKAGEDGPAVRMTTLGGLVDEAAAQIRSYEPLDGAPIPARLVILFAGDRPFLFRVTDAAVECIDMPQLALQVASRPRKAEDPPPEEETDDKAAEVVIPRRGHRPTAPGPVLQQHRTLKPKPCQICKQAFVPESDNRERQCDACRRQEKNRRRDRRRTLKAAIQRVRRAPPAGGETTTAPSPEMLIDPGSTS